VPSNEGTVQSIARAFQLLELLRSREQALGVSELADLSGLSMTTTHRLLKTLVACRAIRQDPKTHAYDLSPHLLGYGRAVLNRFNFLGSVHPILGELSKRVGETVFMGILDDQYDLVYIDQVDTLDHPLRMTPQIGLRQPAHCTALGKVLLSSLPSQRLSEFMQRRELVRKTEFTITSPDLLSSHLNKVRQDGFATDQEEMEHGICCVAAPVRNSRETIAAVSISGPAGRLRLKGLEDNLSTEIRATADQLSTFIQNMEMRG
jgi:IclR family KDG regulon transcriptional repressor